MCEITRATFLAPCPACAGRGSIDRANGQPDPYADMIALCLKCSGTGEVLTEAAQLAWSVISGHREQAHRELTER